jgi:hypothetical protein
MEHTPRGGLTPNEWLDEFQEAAETSIRSQLSTEEDRGTLHQLELDHRKDGVWAIASFSMDKRPGVTFVRSQKIMPDLSADWDPSFAAMLFDTHLIEWFHTEAKRQSPDTDGFVRN